MNYQQIAMFVINITSANKQTVKTSVAITHTACSLQVLLSEKTGKQKTSTEVACGVKG